jgi:hypothetical protein
MLSKYCSNRYPSHSHCGCFSALLGPKFIAEFVMAAEIRQQKLHVVHRPDPGSTAMIRIALSCCASETGPIRYSPEAPLQGFTSSLGIGRACFVATLAKRRTWNSMSTSKADVYKSEPG